FRACLCQRKQFNLRRRQFAFFGRCHRCPSLPIISQNKGSPRLISRVDFLPRISSRYLGASPTPGRRFRTLLDENSCPAEISSTAYSERRDGFASRGYEIEPRACSASRTDFTNSANSSTVSEKKLSAVLSSRESIKCFSIIHAPSATEAMGTLTPKLWSDKPAGQPNVFCR